MKKIINIKSALNNNRDLSNDLIALYKKATDDDIKNKLTWELTFFKIKFNGGKIIDSRGSLGGNLTPQKIDPFNQFSEKTYQYLKIRSTDETSDKAKIIYNLILWNSKEKEFKYVKIVIDLMVDIILNQEFKIQDPFDFTYIDNCIGLILSTKHKEEKIKPIISKVFESDDQDSPYYKYLLLNIMVKNKYFKTDSFEQGKYLLDEIYEHFITKRRIFLADNLKKLAIKISSKISIDENQWKVKCGMIYENHADSRSKEDNPIVAFNYYNEAIKEFHKGGSKDDKTRVSTKIKDLKKRQLLNNVKIGGNEKIVEKLRLISIQKAEALLKEEPNTIYDYLARGDQLYPSYKYIMSSKENRSVFHQFIYTNLEFDINKNLKKRDNSHEAIFNEAGIRNYKIYLEGKTFPFLIHLFHKGFTYGKIGFESIINYMKDNSWYSKILTDNDVTGNEYNYCWLNLIAPSIYNFCDELGLAISEDDRYSPSFVLCLDSLVLKFEGLLRDIVKIQGSSTQKVVREEVREKTIEDILRMEEITSLFSNDDLLLFKYIFTRQGLNLRNDISHSYYQLPAQYQYKNMLLLMMCFLKVGNLEIE